MCKYFKAELVIARSEIGVEEKEDSCTNLKRPPRGGLNSITVGDMIERQSSLITSLVTEQLPQLLAWSFLNEQTCSLQLTDSMYYMHSSFQVPSQFHSSPITVVESITIWYAGQDRHAHRHTLTDNRQLLRMDSSFARQWPLTNGINSLHIRSH